MRHQLMKFYGAATVAAFASPDLAPLVDVTLSAKFQLARGGADMIYSTPNYRMEEL